LPNPPDFKRHYFQAGSRIFGINPKKERKMADAESKIAARIVAKAWASDEFKKQLLANPAEVLAAEGLKVAPDVQVISIASSPVVTHFLLPEKPSDLNVDALADADMAKAICYSVCEMCGCIL
jgi:hypothetical protein